MTPINSCPINKMTKQEAIEVMKQGKKVTHDYFIGKEFIRIENGNIVDEQGHVLQDFWFFRQAVEWSGGWSIFE